MDKQWEYLVCNRHDLPYLDVESSLKELGEDGWELVSVSHNKYYFKRPK